MKQLTILGGGESGTGAALLGIKQGYRVFVSDSGEISKNLRKDLKEAGINFEENGHSLDKIKVADEIIKSPGIAEKSAIMVKVRELHIPVISEIEFAFRYSKDKNIIAVTGSNGKSTTTALTYHMLKTAGRNAACVGNIGYSFARQVAVSPVSDYVVEVSSFQLDDIETFKPHIAILLNITPDHLDRYEFKMEQYIKSKFNIASNQTREDYFIYCQDDENICTHLKSTPVYSKNIAYTIMEPLKEGGFVEKKQLHVLLNDDHFTMSIYDLALKGKHNLYNSMAASIAARSMDIRKDIIRESLATFKGLEHRLEFVATIRGIDFINDSKATNVNSVWFALESMEKPVTLILGGIDKGNDYSMLKELVRQKVKAIVCLGTENSKIHDSFKGVVTVMKDVTNARDAVRVAYQLSSKGDVVLLSPACASFDLFKNYEDRGRQFREAVKDL